LRPLRRAARIGGFLTLTSVMLPAFVARRALTPAARRDPVRDAWVRAWSGGLLRLFSITIDLDPRGWSVARSHRGGRLIVANHRSAIDVAVLLRIFGGYMVSRADLSEWPLVGAAAKSVGTIFVDRSSTTSGAGALREIRRNLKEGQTVILFPEGTTFEGDSVRPFHAGAFVSALHAGTTIVPVGLAYPLDSQAAFVDETFTRHLVRMAGAGATRLAVRVGEPMRVAPHARASDLATAARDAVQALVSAARAAVG
jgi:1-acyl-sn-glycerol-3-phosphate acyltransferase